MGIPRKVPGIPAELLDWVIAIAHSTGGHQATEATLAGLLKTVYFPAMRREVADYIEVCKACQAKGHQQPN